MLGLLTKVMYAGTKVRYGCTGQYHFLNNLLSSETSFTYELALFEVAYSTIHGRYSNSHQSKNGINAEYKLLLHVIHS